MTTFLERLYLSRIFLAVALSLSCCLAGAATPTTVNIATIDNPDMVMLQRLSSEFESANPDIVLRWITMSESDLRQRALIDAVTQSGQFDLITIGAYETPLWAKKGWLVPLSMPPSYEAEDVIQSVRDGLSFEGRQYALPFYAESSMTYYRKDLFDKAGLSMPAQPTWDDISGFAEKLNDAATGMHGICLRGKPGWGENMAIISTMVNSYGGRWFDMQWKPMVDTPAWNDAVGMYANLLRKFGPAEAIKNGFNENLKLFSQGQCAMWVDATIATGMLFAGKESQVADKVAFAPAPIGTTVKGSHWLWSWALAVPNASRHKEQAQRFAAWATSREYIALVANKEGWASVPSGTRKSTYLEPAYQQSAPFAGFVFDAIQGADPNDATVDEVPYSGVQFVTIPQFQSIGTLVARDVADVLTGTTDVASALRRSQTSVDAAMRRAGYYP